MHPVLLLILYLDLFVGARVTWSLTCFSFILFCLDSVTPVGCAVVLFLFLEVLIFLPLVGWWGLGKVEWFVFVARKPFGFLDFDLFFALTGLNICFCYEWAISQKKWNRLMHSLFGNIIPVFLANMWSMLGGVPVFDLSTLVVGALVSPLYSYRVVGIPLGLLGTILSPVLTTVVNLVFGGSYLALFGSYFLSPIGNAFFGRTVWGWISLLANMGFSWLTPGFFRNLAYFVFEVLGLGWYVSLSALVLVVNTSYWAVFFYSSTGVLGYLALVFCLPFMLAMNISLVYNFIAIVVWAFTGIHLAFVDTNFWVVPVVRLNHLLGFLPLLKALISEGFVIFSMATVSLVKLPVEILDMVYGRMDRKSFRDYRWFWLRFVLGFSMATFYLLGMAFSLNLMLFEVAFMMGLGLFFSGGGLSESFFILLLSGFSFLSQLIPLELRHFKVIFSSRTDASLNLILTWIFSLSSVFNRVEENIFMDGKPRRVNKDTNFQLFTRQAKLNLLYRIMVDHSPLFKAAFVLVMAILLLRFLVDMLSGTVRYLFKIPKQLFNVFLVFLFPFLLPNIFFDVLASTIIWCLRKVINNWEEIHRYLKLTNLTLMWGVVQLQGVIEPKKGKAPIDLELPKLNQLFVRTWVSYTRRSVIKVVEYLDSVRLPEFIQSQYRPPSLESIRSTYSTLYDMGWPVDQSFIDSLERPEKSAYLAEWGSWKNWMLGSSNYATGPKSFPVAVRDWLPKDFYPEFTGYLHTDRIASVYQTLWATARYWTGNHEIQMSDEDFDALVDDTWEAIKPQYEKSRLITYRELINKGLIVMKYNMGVGFFTITNNNRIRQLTRKAVMDTMGGKKNFLEAWVKLAKHVQGMTPVGKIFKKRESLPAKKFDPESGKPIYRTVFGTSWVHSTMSYIWAYIPNHNYKPWETPSKVGMPINGLNFDKLWSSLASREFIWAGDMSKFDSSLPPPLLNVAREIHKRGFELHRDYDRICQLIDISYDHLRDHSMAFFETGDIAWKQQGFTTGHTSTTPDNTIVLIACYLYAWRHITGCRAREFFNFNTLANFGDDHILGYDPVYGWSPELAINAMKKLGVEMRNEAPGQNKMPREGATLPVGVKDWRDAKFSFLAKKPLPLTADIRSELASAGITFPISFPTCHDRQRLLGKIKGELELRKFKSTSASYDALIGYMSLCAHHHDIYTILAKNVMGLRNKYIDELKEAGKKTKMVQKPPSYNDVLRLWYSEKGFVNAPDDPLSTEGDLSGDIYVIQHPDLFGVFVRWISDFPTILSPRYKNVRWADWIQHALSEQMSWPLAFIAKANGVGHDHATARNLLARTPYAFLRSPLITPSSHKSFGTLLFRHWCFSIFQRLVTYRKFFTPLDLVRLLDTFWLNLVYIITGRMIQVVVELDLHILETLVIFLLNYVDIDLPIPPLPYYVFSPSDLIAQVFTHFVRMFTPAGSIDFQSLDARLKLLTVDPSYSFVLSAGTGTGKSTRMVNRIREGTRKRIVVIVPRHAVAVSVGSYMQSLYPSSGVSISTEGHKLDPSFSIAYCTATSFFLNPNLRDPDNIFILDEAHIYEPHYIVMRNYLESPHLRKIFVTATPTKDLKKYYQLEIPAVNSFSVTQKVAEIPSLSAYADNAVNIVNDLTAYEKTLIFVPSLKLMDSIAGRCRNKVCRLSSKHKALDPTASVFISTSVADAGLTIPDVSLVISPDVDVTVLHTEKATVPVWFELSRETMLQRKGRTGRTSDGAFLYYRIEDAEPVDVVFSTPDFMMAMAPAVTESLPYFPGGIGCLTDDQREMVSWWDLGTRFPSWERFLQRIEAVKAKWPDLSGSALWDRFREHIKVVGVGHGTFQWWKGPSDPEEDVLDSFYGAGNDPILELLEKESATQLVQEFPASSKDVKDVGTVHQTNCAATPNVENPPNNETHTDEDGEDNDEAPFVRVDVSGEGLLCGVRVVIGVLVTAYGTRFSENNIQKGLTEMLDPEVVAAISDAETGQLPHDTFFEWGVIRDFLYTKFKIRALLCLNGEEIPEPEGVNQEYPAFIIYLDGQHYNYLGYPYEQYGVDETHYQEAIDDIATWYGGN